MKKIIIIIIGFLIAGVAQAATTISTNITTGGNVGIGSTTPYSRLSIDNTSVATGEELITNGTFTGGTTGWTLGSNATYGDNNVVFTYAGGNPTVSTTFPTEAGKTYILSFELLDANAPMYFYFTNNSEIYDYGFFKVDGVYKKGFKTNYTGNETITFSDWHGNTSDTWTIDNVSIKEISPISPLITLIGYGGDMVFSIGQNFAGNTAIGESTLKYSTGSYNTAFGVNLLTNNTSGTSNTTLGAYSLVNNTSGSSNVAIGTYALTDNETGSNNVAIGGVYPLSNIKTGSNNVAIGDLTLNRNVSGSGNVALGFYAGAYELGSNSFYVNNRNQGTTAADKTNSLLYGTFNTTPSSQTLTINASTTVAQNFTVRGTGVSTMAGKLGIGTSTAVANLQVSNGANATSTFELGSGGQNKGSCMKMYRTDGSAIYAYVAAGATTFTLSTTACTNVTGF